MNTVFINSSVEFTTKDTLTTFVSNMPTEIGVSNEVISNFDTLQNLLYQSNTKLDSIYILLLQKGSDGWGVEQVVSLIIIPLVIAIFAFTLPLISSALSKVEGIYQCDAISKKMECSWQMISYWILLAVCMFMLLLVMFIPSTMPVLIKILPYTTLFLVLSIFVFFYNVRNFAKPYWVVCQLDRWYGYTYNNTIRRLKFKEYIIRIKKYLQKDSYAKGIYETILKLNNNNPYYIADRRFFQQLFALLQLAVNKKDTALLYDIKGKWYNHIVKTKDRSLQRLDNHLSYFYYSDELFLFHEQTITFLGQFNEPEYQELAIEMLRTTLDHGQFPQEYNIGRIIKSFITTLGENGTKLVKRYFILLNKMYRHLGTIPMITYVCGEDIDRKKDLEQEYIKKWEWICDIHFMLAAYVWNKGRYDICNETCPANDWVQDVVLPMSCMDVLYRYLSCRGYYSRISEWEINDIFDISVDEMHKMLIKYTIFLLYFTANREKILYYNLFNDSLLKDIDPKIIDDLKDDKYKQGINTICELVRNNKSSIDLDSVIDETINMIQEKLSEYQGDINQNAISQFQQMLKQTKNIKQVYSEEFYREKNMYNDETIRFNKYSLKIDKSVFILKEIDNRVLINLAESFNEIMNNRYLYMWLSAINLMKVKEIECTAVNFTEKIIQYTKGELDKYAIISLDSPIATVLPQFFKMNNGIKISMYMYSFCSKTRLFGENHHCVFVVKKEDVPSLQYDVEDEQSTSDIKKEFSSNKERLYMRLEIDPHMILQYNKYAEVLKIKHKKLSY